MGSGDRDLLPSEGEGGAHRHGAGVSSLVWAGLPLMLQVQAGSKGTSSGGGGELGGRGGEADK